MCYSEWLGSNDICHIHDKLPNHIHIESHPYKIILSKLTSPAKLCSLTLFDALVNILCGNNLNTIDLFINIYDSISLSPIILMERNFKSDPDPRYETNKNGKLYWLVIFYIFTETIFFILDFDDIRYKNTYHMDLSVTLMFVYNNMYCGHSKC